MKTKAIVAGAVVLVVLLFLAMLLNVSHPQAITVRHVKSVQNGDVTTMTFEIKNHAAIPYFLGICEMQVRNGNAWTRFQGLVSYEFCRSQGSKRVRPVANMMPAIGRTGLVYCMVDVTNLPVKSVVRLSVITEKGLLGLSGLFRRAELNWRNRGGNYYRPSLNPYDKNAVLGRPIEVTSDEFVETAVAAR